MTIYPTFRINASPELIAALALCTLDEALVGEPSRDSLLRLWRAVSQKARR